MTFRLRSLYWRLALVIVAVFGILGAVITYVSLRSADRFQEQTTARVYAGMAGELVAYMQSMGERRPSESAIAMVVSRARKINPMTDVYFLDPAGRIVFSSVSRDSLIRHAVPLDPIQRVLATPGEAIQGDDPRTEDATSIFSAATLLDADSLRGYIYVILLGSAYRSVVMEERGGALLSLGALIMPIAFTSAAAIALLLLWLLTLRLRTLARAVGEFGGGNLAIRIVKPGDDEIGELATSFNSMADTIASHVDEIKRTDEVRRELIANISHDLKTPLSSIRGYVDTLIMKNDTLTADERRSYLDVVSRSVRNLVSLIEQLLELSRLDARQVQPEPVAFPLGELVSDVLQKLQPQAERSRIRLRTVMEEHLPLVMADIGLIERALQNLIDNAIRYTPEIGVVTVELARHGEGVLVKVTDTGQGIAEEDLPHVFDRFYRSEKSRSRASGGTGLGLAIVRKILELHGRMVTVESSLNVGTSFVFTLPAAG